MSKYRSLLKDPIPQWENRNVVWMEPEGAYTVEDVLTPWDFGMEGYLLAHCIGTKDAKQFLKDHRVLSLRDRLGISHCTILLQREGRWSPYGASADMVSVEPMELQGQDYRVLQVRGRQDHLARWEYYQMVRHWYLSLGGMQECAFDDLRRAVMLRQDSDLKYHYGYMLDESVNHFEWAHHNEEYVRRYRKWGLSL